MKKIEPKPTKLELVNLKTKKLIANFMYDLAEGSIIEQENDVTTIVLDECEKYPGICLDMDAEIKFTNPLSNEVKEGILETINEWKSRS